MQARFEIVPRQESKRMVEQKIPLTLCVVFKATGNTVEDAKLATLNREWDVSVDGKHLHFGPRWAAEARPNNLLLRGWGTWTCPERELVHLRAMQDTLPALFKKLSIELCREIVWELQEPRTAMVEETVTIPSRIFFQCGAVVDKPILGKAEGLTIEYRNSVTHLTLVVNTLFLKRMGWLQHNIDALRSKFSDAVITAAFQDLAKNMVAADTTPVSAAIWTWRPAQTLELV